MPNWKDLLGHLRRASCPAPRTSHVIQAQVTPSVVRYLDVLLSDLVERQAEATLRTGEALPLAGRMGGELPPCDRVLNRLKALSGLTPVAYAQPVTRDFEYTLRHRVVRVSACFVDRRGESSCRLSVKHTPGAQDQA